MSTDAHEERLARRVADLYATDQQFADARPSEAITAAIEQPGLRLPQLVQTVMVGYADRPALGHRAVQFLNDPESGRTSLELLPRFETVSYRELWDRAGAVASALTDDPEHSVRPGDRVCVLGFTSVDYATVDVALVSVGAVSVPLQTSAPVSQLQPIVVETEPSVIATDLALVRPTELTFVPRIWDMLFGEFQSELDRRSSDGADRAALEAEVIELEGAPPCRIGTPRTSPINPVAPPSSPAPTPDSASRQRKRWRTTAHTSCWPSATPRKASRPLPASVATSQSLNST